jgi:hypothetical protein
VRDDIAKLPLSKKAKKYARMTSADLGDDWSKKVDLYMDMVAADTGQSKEGFKNRDATGVVPHAFKGLGEAIVEALLFEALYSDTGEYRYLTNCVGSTSELIHDMVDKEVPVSKAEFFRNVPLREVFESGIGYIYDWSKEQARTAGVDYDELLQNRGGLRMWNDWHIAYYKSVYDGRPCYFFDHSRIEYIFVKP